MIRTTAIGIGCLVALHATSTSAHARQGPLTFPESMSETYQADVDSLESKFIRLADAFTEEQFSWRPMEGVRSVSEVLMLVAAENYYVPSGWDVDPPAGIDLTAGFFNRMNEVTDKSDVLRHLRESFDYYSSALADLTDDDLPVTRSFFGQQAPTGYVLYLIAIDQHEHLGQLIAYARTNHVVPPWSR